LVAPAQANSLRDLLIHSRNRRIFFINLGIGQSQRLIQDREPESPLPGVSVHSQCLRASHFAPEARQGVRSCALSRGDGGEGRPALLDLLASAVRAGNVAFLVIDKGKDLIEEHFAVEAEEFVVGHAGPLLRRADRGILDLVPGGGQKKRARRQVGV